MATIDSLIAVSEARESGMIRRRNALKIDSKVNEMISKLIKQEAPEFTITLPERLEMACGQHK